MGPGKIKAAVAGDANEAAAACAHFNLRTVSALRATDRSTGIAALLRFLSDVTESGALAALVACVSRGGFCAVMAAKDFLPMVMGLGGASRGACAAGSLVAAGALPAFVKNLRRAAEAKGADRVPSIICAGDVSLVTLAAFMSRKAEFRYAYK